MVVGAGLCGAMPLHCENLAPQADGVAVPDGVEHALLVHVVAVLLRRTLRARLRDSPAACEDAAVGLYTRCVHRRRHVRRERDRPPAPKPTGHVRVEAERRRLLLHSERVAHRLGISLAQHASACHGHAGRWPHGFVAPFSAARAAAAAETLLRDHRGVESARRHQQRSIGDLQSCGAHPLHAPHHGVHLVRDGIADQGERLGCSDLA
mmetsp:Transcript_22488/g.64682  ORF Transcript_22488/g.64682 Transcript_22488/m.64682 type:complete len:208 (-) Transcript_22488:1300-1923(-)